MTTRIGLMFAGQGAQFPGMGKDLYESYSAAKEIFAQADEIAGRSISRLCFESPLEELTACANCQPAIFTVSAACYRVLQQEFPFIPAICAGLSLGEYSALFAAGVYDFASCLQLVSARGRLMDTACKAKSGAMAALLGVPGDILQETCQRHGLEVANYNSETQVIISGDSAEIDAAVGELMASGQKAMRLQVAGAFHSSFMQSAVEGFAAELEKHPVSAPQTLVAQNFTGTIVSNPAEIQKNLLYQISGSVRWDDCAKLLKEHCDVLVEIGPGSVLSGLMRRLDRRFPVLSVNSSETLTKTLEYLRGKCMFGGFR